MADTAHDSAGVRARRESMSLLFRFLPLAIPLLLTACAPDCGPGPDCREARAEAPAKPRRADADKHIAMFMKDPANEDAWRWLCRAAADGHTAAQYTVAVRYRDGLPPVEQDIERAFLWFSAAQRGGLTAAAAARADMVAKLDEAEREALRELEAAAIEADCAEEN